MSWRKRLEDELRRAVKHGDVNVDAPRNIRVAINTGEPGTTTVASATQHTEINQSTRERKTEDD
jgi:hypothetical protein